MRLRSKRKQKDTKFQEPIVETLQTNKVVVRQEGWAVSIKMENGASSLQISNYYYQHFSASFDDWEIIVHLVVQAFKQFKTLK